MAVVLCFDDGTYAFFERIAQPRSGPRFAHSTPRAPTAPVQLNPAVLPRLEEIIINKALEKNRDLCCQSDRPWSRAG
jgi:hypothetical protein